MFAIELKFFDDWRRIAEGYESRDDAEWELGQWKRDNQCRGDACFRVVPVT